VFYFCIRLFGLQFFYYICKRNDHLGQEIDIKNAAMRANRADGTEHSDSHGGELRLADVGIEPKNDSSMIVDFLIPSPVLQG